MSITFDPHHEAEELREQLGSDKRRLLLFFGAGVSQAAGIDGIADLTIHVRADLNSTQQRQYDRILSESGSSGHVERVLDKVRLCRELIGHNPTATADGFTGSEAIEMDRAICRAIYVRAKIDPPMTTPRTRWESVLSTEANITTSVCPKASSTDSGQHLRSERI
jgi:hypothetical protein